MIITGTTIFPKGVSTWVRDCYDLGARNAKLTINSAVTYDCSYCGDYAVYYTNKYGGWCSFLFEGNCKQIDNLTDHKYDRVVDNQSIDWERNRYLTEIRRTYELKTGWLTDEEAEKFATDLIPTTKMYLHILGNDELLPAVVMDTTAEHKTFRNQGKKFVQYTLMVEASQNRLRR